MPSRWRIRAEPRRDRERHGRCDALHRNQPLRGRLMPEGGNYARIRRTGAQFLRFMTVGATNTVIDVAVTNALVLLIHPQSAIVLMLISIAACALATLNSYALNRRWTFRHASGEVPEGAAAKFFA